MRKSKLIKSNRHNLFDALPPEFNVDIHEDETVPRRMIWTSKGTLTVATYTPWHPNRPGMFIAAKASVSTAGSTTTKFDILLDGISIFDGSTLVEVPASVLKGKRRPITRKQFFYQDSKIQIKIDTKGTGVEGPAVVEIEYEAGF